jgi:hypothetical protein
MAERQSHFLHQGVPQEGLRLTQFGDSCLRRQASRGFRPSGNQGEPTKDFCYYQGNFRSKFIPDEDKAEISETAIITPSKPPKRVNRHVEIEEKEETDLEREPEPEEIGTLRIFYGINTPDEFISKVRDFRKYGGTKWLLVYDKYQKEVNTSDKLPSPAPAKANEPEQIEVRRIRRVLNLFFLCFGRGRRPSPYLIFFSIPSLTEFQKKRKSGKRSKSSRHDSRTVLELFFTYAHSSDGVLSRDRRVLRK